MRLKSISATNLKGKTFTYQLGAGTAIIGPNFAGKTAVIDAIVLLFKGYIPAVGKTAKATWELCSGPTMTVRGEFEGDVIQERSFWLDSGTVKSSLTMGGAIGLDDIPLLDAEQYFGMTDRERTNYVFARIKLPDIYTADAIIAELEQISFEEGHSEQIQKAKSLQLKSIEIQFRDKSIQDALEALIETYKEQFTHWNRRSKETQGAVKTLTELKLREKEASTDAISQLKSEMEKVQNELSGLVETKGRLTEQRDQVSKNTTAIHLLEQKLAVPQVDFDATIERCDALIKEMSDAMTREDDKAANQRLAASRGVVERIAMLQAALGEWRETRARCQSRLESIGEMTCCPTCKAKAKGWKANVEAEITASLEAVSDKIKEGEKDLRTSQASLQTFEKKILADEKRASDNRTRARAIEDAGRDRQQAVKAKEAAAQRRTELETDLKEKRGWVAPTMENGLDEIESDRVRAATKLAGLRERHDAAFALQHDIRRAAEAQIEHRQAAAHVAVIKRIQSVLSDRKSTIVDDVFGALLETANRIFGSIFQTPLTLQNNTVGRWSHEGKFIPHRVFSGTEKKLAYIAIATALSSQAAIRIPMLDEFGTLDSDNQADVLAQLQRAVKEQLIDQYIVVGTTMPDGDYRDLSVIQMTP